MRELRFVCVEDDELFMQKMTSRIQSYFQDKGYKVILYMYQDIPKNLSLNNINACFFDIEINDKNTIDLIKDIRDKGFCIPIIVVSQHESYVFETVHMQIFDYIRKEKFDQEIERTLNRLQNVVHHKIKSVLIHYQGRTMEILFSDIAYIHIKSHHFVIHDIYGKETIIWKNYDDIFVENSTLIRVHKSYVINIYHCERIGKNEAFLRGYVKSIPISTRNYNYVLSQFVSKQNFIK